MTACRLLFVGAVRGLLATTLCVLGASGCDDGWHQGDPDEWAVSGWQLVPSTRDLRVGVALDPRRVSRPSDTVELVGPSLLVEGDTVVSTLAVGTTRVVLGDSIAWLLQTSQASWPYTAPTSAPPRVPYVIGRSIDRDTLATTGTVTWSPPIDRPVMVGDDLLDLPGSGFADVARDLVVRLRDREGGATELLGARGYDLVSCVGNTGVIVAVRLESAPAAVEVVSVRREVNGTWVTERASFANVRFDPSEVACDRDARRIALVTQTGVQVLDPASASVALSITGGAAPMVLRADGQALVAARDRGLIFVDAQGERATGLVSKTDPSRPVVTGDLAMFELERSVALIDLVDGAVLHQIGALPGEDSMFPFQMAAWHPGNAFVIALAAYDTATDYADHLRRLAIVTRDGVTELALPSAVRDPSVHVSERALHVVVDTTDEVGDFVLATYDLATAMPTSEILLPLCDSARVLERQGCR